jgi:hypothetical protein
METTDEQIMDLKNYLKALGLQTGVVYSKQEIAETTLAILSQEVHRLREQLTQAIQQLRDIESHQSGFYLWENIGEGG